MGQGDVAVVLPVRDGIDHIAAAIEAMRPQMDAIGAEIVVVDDASTDGSAEAAEQAGARVVALDEPAGPYVARNAGWRSTDAGIVVFTDVRNRAQPQWLAELIAPLADPEVAISGGTVRMAGGDRVAERWARRAQLLDVEERLRSDWLPYAPTASMAVRRTVLEALDGFRAVRSAGDVDLCWRAQLAGLGSVAAAPASLMTCEPRTSAREVMRQWTRYGYSNHEVRTRYGPDGCPPPLPLPRRRLVLETLRGLAGAVRHRRDLPVELLDWARIAAYQRAYRRAARGPVQ